MTENLKVNPWVVEAPKAYEAIPNGAYMVEFKGVEFLELNGDPKVRLSWEVKSGPQAGKAATALADKSINKNKESGRLLSGLLGRDIVIGENVMEALDACVGKTYMIVFGPGQKGGKPAVRSCSNIPAM